MLAFLCFSPANAVPQLRRLQSLRKGLPAMSDFDSGTEFTNLGSRPLISPRLLMPRAPLRIGRRRGRWRERGGRKKKLALHAQ